jgi:hypothetical protein
MKNRMLMVCGVLLLGASPGAAQIPGCGGATPKTDIWQAPNWELRVNGYTQTTRNMDGCSIKLRVEAWVEGIAMGVMAAESWGPAVSVPYSVPVPHAADWTAVGKHWAIFWGVSWNWLGRSSDTTTVSDRPPADPAPTDDTSTGDDGTTLASGDPSCDGCVSPLLFDRDGDGFHLTSAADGVLFDIDADGVLDRVAWTRLESGDAWLAYDRNGNGRIDDGSELFGNRTPAYQQQRMLTARNGFEALGFMQSPEYGQSYADDVIDARDTVFGRLLLWTDANHNGISEVEEIETAADAGLVTVGLQYAERKRRDQHGNEFRLRGESTWLNDRGKARNAAVWDVWLRVSP